MRHKGMSTSDEMDKQHRDSEGNSGSVDGVNEENSKSPGGNESQAGPNADNTADILGKIGFSKKDKHKKDSELLKQENEELKIQIAELNDKFLRLYAEFDNFKKRSSKERM